MRKGCFRVALVMCLCFSLLCLATSASASLNYFTSEIGYYDQGGLLGNTPDYEWWYGCSPTSAGMMMGYYDINGYGGLYYPNLVPGTAEMSTYPTTSWAYNAAYVIASPEHVSAFWGTENPASHPVSEFNSLADFMGTSQASLGNNDGWTSFYYWNSGDPFYASDAASAGIQDDDGMYGIWEYVGYCGYDVPLDNIFTQHIYESPTSFPNGFTFEDYMAEIDAGKVVLVHVTDHTMLGYGYDDATDTIYVYDTWGAGGGSFPWEGSYAGLELWGVTVFTPAGGAAAPLPPSVLLFGTGLAGVLIYRRRQIS